MLSGFLKGLATGLVWALTTTAAVTLSWWGVHTVMAGTAYDPPRALPIPSGSSHTSRPVVSSTHRPSPSPTPTPSRTTPRPTPPSHSPSPSRKPSGSPSSPRPSGEVENGVVRAYDTRGGRVVLDIGRDEASLVSATPQPGWSMQVAKSSSYVSVAFVRDQDTVQLACTWSDEQQPQVQIAETSAY